MSDFSSANPYAVTTAELVDVGLTGSGDAVAIRNKYLSHEASVKSVGLLYWLGAVFGIFAAIVYVVMGLRLLSDENTLASRSSLRHPISSTRHRSSSGFCWDSSPCSLLVSWVPRLASNLRVHHLAVQGDARKWLRTSMASCGPASSR